MSDKKLCLLFFFSMIFIDFAVGGVFDSLRFNLVFAMNTKPAIEQTEQVNGIVIEIKENPQTFVLLVAVPAKSFAPGKKEFAGVNSSEASIIFLEEELCDKLLALENGAKRNLNTQDKQKKFVILEKRYIRKKKTNTRRVSCDSSTQELVFHPAVVGFNPIELEHFAGARGFSEPVATMNTSVRGFIVLEGVVVCVMCIGVLCFVLYRFIK